MTAQPSNITSHGAGGAQSISVASTQAAKQINAALTHFFIATLIS